MEKLKRMLSRIKRLNWKWWVLISILLALFIVFVAAPAYVYYSRDRNPQNYEGTTAEAEMVYKVNYDSGEGNIDQSQRILRMVDTGVMQNGITCFHVVTLYDDYPKRKVNAPIVQSTTIESGENEMWRSQSDLRMVFKKLFEMGLPIVNTVVSEVTYSNYENYPGWPYHLDDSWTYEVLFNVDVSFISDWTDFYEAKVVDDSVTIEIGGKAYSCFEVAHTLVDTTNSRPSGGGVGAEMIEYWYKDSKWIAPIKIEDSISYKGIETSIMSGRMPPPSL